MPTEGAPIRRLARRSLRVHGLLIGVIALATLQFGLLISSGLLHLQEHQKRLERDFQRLHAALNEQERFVRRWRLHQPPPRTSRADSDSLIALSRAIVSRTDTAEPLPETLADAFLAFHGSYWAQTPFPGPQCMLVNGRGDYGLMAPIDRGHPQRSDSGSQYPPRLREQIHHIAVSDPLFSTGQVIWEGPDASTPDSTLLAVTQSIPSPETGMSGKPDTAAIGCLLRPSALTSPLSPLNRETYSRFSLIAADGSVLLGTVPAGDLSPPRPATRPRITRDGLRYHFLAEDGWHGLYDLHWSLLLRQPRGPLLSSALAALLLALGGAVVIHFYRQSVLDPLRSQHLRLLESEAFSRTILSHAPVGVCLLRTSDDTVMLDNPQVREWLGSDHEAGGWAGDWRGALADPTIALRESERDYITPAGRILRITATPARYKGHGILLCLFIDITSQVEAEETLLEARRASEQANQAKSQFLATVSHEIRTPLYGILGTLELLALTRLDDRQTQHVQTIQASSSILMHLINDILDLSKAEAGQLQTVMGEACPARLTEDAAQAWAAAAAGKGLMLYACIQPDLPPCILTDAPRVRQILDNLLSNAIKFTEHGHVILRATIDSETADGNGRIHWQVADSGIGIDRQHQSKLFEAFYQADTGLHRVRGTGLGLSISAHLAEKMGGAIALTSEVGLGSSFTLSLPVVPCTSQRMPGDSPATPPGSPLMAVVAGVPRELQDNLAARLLAAGIHADTYHPDTAHDADPHTVLVMLPFGEPPVWQGPALFTRMSGDEALRPRGNAWEVGLHHLSAIVTAIQRTATPAEDTPPPSIADRAFSALDLDVLVVEDNPINQTILHGQLQRLGCRPTLAPDGKRALQHLDDPGFQVILTDINMPEMDGLALTRAIRERGIALPVIGITASTSADARQACLDAGMDEVLTKPFAIHDLQRLLARFSPSSGTTETPAGPFILQIPDGNGSLFLSVLTQDLAALDAALAEGAPDEVARKVHRLAGAIGMLGDGVTARCCQLVETRLDAGDTLIQLAEPIAQIRTGIQSAIAGIARVLDGDPAP